jgi:pimeloyl-ACP methyl ester carboxylesterase
MGGDASLRLRDGRSLSYGLWGDADGVPVFGFHGGGLSRLQHYGGEAPASAGVRLILPDRPGSGLSDPHPGATLLDWPNDVAELADRLEVERFAVFGVSAGGPSALACGYALPSRVAAVGLVSAVGPYVDEPSLLPHVRPDGRQLVELALRDPDAASAEAEKQCEEEARVLAADPEGMVDAWPPDTPESDREVMAEPEIRARFLAAFRETAAQGSAGLLYDTLLHYVQPWGFRAAEVSVPVLIWHGGRDTHVPVESARLLASCIPGARLTEYPEEGHSVDYRHIDEILGSLAELVAQTGHRSAEALRRNQ